MTINNHVRLCVAAFSIAMLSFPAAAIAGPRGDLKREASDAVEKLRDSGEPKDRCGLGVNLSEGGVVVSIEEISSFRRGDRLISLGEMDVSQMGSEEISEELREILPDARLEVGVLRDNETATISAICQNSRPSFEFILEGLDYARRRKFDDCANHFSSAPNPTTQTKGYALRCASVSRNSEQHDVAALARDAISSVLRDATWAPEKREVSLTGLRAFQRIIEEKYGEDSFSALIAITREWPNGENAWEDSEPDWTLMKANAERALAEKLIDPSSAEVTWPHGFILGTYKPFLQSGIDGYITCGTVNARNRLGGYVGRRYSIVVMDENAQALHADMGTGDDIDFVTMQCENSVSNLPAPQWSEVEIVSQSSNAEPTLAQQLRDLADLHESGVLTDEEFSAAKEQLLNR